jgi:hypothetical protein
MRRLWSDSSGIFGMVCGGIVVATVARYGFKTTDNGLDGIITALFFGIIAVGGLFGHARAVRLWRAHKVAAVFVGVVSAIAFVINISNSVGFIAARGDKQQADRAKTIETAKANRAELARKEAERASIGAFVATDAATVRAAERAADTATNIRAAECGKRGPLCRQREAEETQKAAELATATANKGTTERADDIDYEIKRLKKALEAADPVVSANPFHAMLGRLFKLPEDRAELAATWQQFAVAAIVEALIVAALISAELSPCPAPAQTLAAKPEPKVVEVVIPEPVAAAEPVQIAPSAKKRPRLVTSDVGSVPAIMADLMEPTEGQRVEIEDSYRAYAAECRATGKRPVQPVEFIEPMETFCRECGIETATRGRKIYLLNVQLISETRRLTA